MRKISQVGCVDIYTSDFNLENDSIEHLTGVLQPQEIVKANACLHHKDKNRAIISRAHLRLALAEFLHLPAQEITLNFNRYGKPNVYHLDASLHFNVSHSGDHIVYAFAKNCAVGIDIEQCKPINELSGMIDQIATTQEASMLGQITDYAEKLRLFYQLWSRKEAVAKCLGKGFSLDVRTIDALNHYSLRETFKVTVHDLTLTPELNSKYSIALAVASMGMV